MMTSTLPTPSTAIRGVNLGGWLVLEKWMTPTLFDGTNANDEYSLMQTPGAKQKITHHRDTFITESDFAWIRDHGIQAVRIPIGYWIFDGDGPYIPAITYLDWVFNMAQQYSLNVIIDMHGLKGSQNGWDHSGHSGVSDWFKYTSYRNESIKTAERLVERYRDRDNFWGLQIINEPKLGPVKIFKLLAFYKQAYKDIYAKLPEQTYFIVSDGYIPRIVMFLLPRSFRRLVLDVHIYHMTTPFAQYRSLDWFYKKTRRRARLITYLSKKHPVIIGEWSGVLRSEITKNMNKADETKATKYYTQLQIESFAPALGWFYWNYKTEQPGTWNLRSIVDTKDVVWPFFEH
ncbi:MAG: cellulase family glycosylhydrolase [Candidatus Microsaccharimonas sp.]